MTTKANESGFTDSPLAKFGYMSRHAPFWPVSFHVDRNIGPLMLRHVTSLACPLGTTHLCTPAYIRTVQPCLYMGGKTRRWSRILGCVAEGDSVALVTWVPPWVSPAVVIGWMKKPETRPHFSCLFNQPITIAGYTNGDMSCVTRAMLSPSVAHLGIRPQVSSVVVYAVEALVHYRVTSRNFASSGRCWQKNIGAAGVPRRMRMRVRNGTSSLT